MKMLATLDLKIWIYNIIYDILSSSNKDLLYENKNINEIPEDNNDSEPIPTPEPIRLS